MISDHGNWPHNHLGAINALYGRTPFFPYLFPELSDIYRNLPATTTEFNLRLHRLICRWLDFEAIGDIPENEAVSQSIRYVSTFVNYDISILDGIFRLGKDMVLALLMPADTIQPG